MELIPHSLTPRIENYGIRSLVESGKILSPVTHPELYPHRLFPKAAPQCISGRTSYLQVRLAFYPYPQLIPQFCHTERFEPPQNFTPASLWSWIDHLVSGLIHATRHKVPPPCSDSLSLRLRNASCLTLRLRKSTRRLILQ